MKKGNYYNFKTEDVAAKAKIDQSAGDVVP